MVIQEYVQIGDERLMNGLLPSIRIMSQIEKSSDDDIVIDFSRTKFVSPLFLVSLIVYSSRCGKKITVRNMNAYMETICFHTGGICPDQLRQSEFLAMMEGYSRKTYIPIISFPAQTNSDEKETMLSLAESIVIRQSRIENNVAIGVKYMLEETIDNITEHSATDRGYIFAQSYPQKGFLDICIADRGITLLGSYRNMDGNEIEDDIEAIKAANKRISSKNRPETENRGYGIYTSKKMLIEGLGGQYMMISGSALYVKSKSIDNFYALPDNLRFQGTIVALRIPYQNKSFNYINYVE